MIADMVSFSGILLIVLSASAFGFLPIFARLVSRDGAGTLTMLFLRFTIAGCLMLAYLYIGRMGRAWRKGRIFPRGKTLVMLLLMGAVGYVGQSFCYFTSLEHSQAALTALLLYLYPSIVSLLSAVFFREAFTVQKGLALILALAGTVLLVGTGTGSPAGVFFGIAAAFIYSVYIIVGSRVVPAGSSAASSTVIMFSAAAVYGMLVLFNGFEPPQSGGGILALLGLALVATVVAIVTFFAGMARIGPSRAAIISNFEPVVSVLAAAFILGEELSSGSIAGGLLILCSLIVLGFKRRARKRRTQIEPQSK